MSLNATELLPGELAVITQVLESPFSIRLMEMGCVPGTPVFIEFAASGGDPIALNVGGYVLGLRRNEARVIEVRRTDGKH